MNEISILLESRLHQRRLIPSDVTDRDRRLIEEIAAMVDDAPGALQAVVDVIAQIGLAQAHVQIAYDLAYTFFDVTLWQFEWEAFDVPSQKLLLLATCVREAFDVRMCREILELEVQQVEEALHELVQGGWLLGEREGDQQMLYNVRWSTRMLVFKVCGKARVLAYGQAHAEHFIARVRAHLEAARRPRDFEVKHLEVAARGDTVDDPDCCARAALTLFRATAQKARFHELTVLFERLLNRRPLESGDWIGVELRGRLGELYRAQGRYEESIEMLELALAMIPSTTAHVLAISIRIALATSLSYIAQRERALCMVKEAEVLARQRDEPEQLYKALKSMGTISFRCDELDSAMRLFEESLQMQPADIATMNNLGGIYSILGRAHMARHYQDRSLRAVAGRDDVYRHELIALNNAVAVDLCLGEVEVAERHMRRTDELYEIIGSVDLCERPMTLLNKALYELTQGTLLESYTWLDKSLDIEVTPSALGMRVSLLSWLGHHDEASQVMVMLEEAVEDHRQYVGLCDYARLSMRLGQATSSHSHHDIAALYEEVRAMDWTSCSCMIQVMFMDLLRRLRDARPDALTLHVDDEMKWIRRSSDTEPVDLRRSTVTRRLLEVFITHHRSESSERPCTLEMLHEAVWPGEVWNLSARTKLYTALHRLRERVLGDLLTTHEDEGYSLDPRCRIEPLEPSRARAHRCDDGE